ncbi:phosphate-starvation-inducible protein PsiE [Rhabdochromatium marinum]|uniref:phosphate-starvation-inducible protein PsiE n=1 Tax=Rhabdochromatium marinum TaxID=48729 RepID=UPI00190562C8|nr:phosphate-starvation-inducible PsiE family protein [Rhabdochromatium marinum]MBK1648200.1 phosphate-starvation-inducible E [Rhabdochromatium marinum]
MNPKKHIDAFLSGLFSYVEKLVLLLVGGLALVGIGQILLAIYVSEAKEIRLEDLLQMFIFIEIMAMANVYFQHHEVPFTFPMFIAITALSRLIVLQGKDIQPETLLYQGGAVLLVSCAILVIRYSQRYLIPPESSEMHPGNVERH